MISLWLFNPTVVIYFFKKFKCLKTDTLFYKILLSKPYITTVGLDDRGGMTHSLKRNTVNMSLLQPFFHFHQQNYFQLLHSTLRNDTIFNQLYLHHSFTKLNPFQTTLYSSPSFNQGHIYHSLTKPTFFNQLGLHHSWLMNRRGGRRRI